MRQPLLFMLLIASHLISMAQRADTLRIARVESADALLAPLFFLSSDALRGRQIATPEIDTAAAYIASQFKRAGAKTLPGGDGYYQIFSFQFKRLSQMVRMEPQLFERLSFVRPTHLINVLAYVRGTDPILSKQFIVLSSHYDHIGVADSASFENGKRDSIFNGARDNAAGTAAVIAAARYFARYPPRRSVLFICYTAEEEGLIGSNFFATHSLVPLEHIVYNLNVDNASYNTTNAVCIFGRDRTSENSIIQRACRAYGLAALEDPTGGAESLFERSDNLSLAKWGVPALTYSMGMTAWDDGVTNRYHRLSDEADNIDKDYMVKFIRAYILVAQGIANDPKQPRWAQGDFYEEFWKTLYHGSAK